MRNDIKRFFVAVLAACGLAVSAALAAAAPDITDRLQNLGIPLIDRYPDGKITQSTYARNVWDMKYHDGKVFIGSGNSANTGPSPNAGPAEVWEIDPATGAAQLSYKIGGEQADLFRVFSDGCLYVPDHDPPGTSSYNCYYKRDTSGNWSNGGWLTDEKDAEVHVYDMAEFDGKMFACGYYLWCSDDGGANWCQKKYPLGGRKYAFLPYGDQLMTSTGYGDWNSSDAFRYWNKAQQIWAVPDPISAAMAFPDQSNLPGNDLKLVRPAQFGNKCLYIGAYELNDHQNDPFGAYVSTFDGTTFSATAIPAATGQVPWDILVKDGTAYLLVQDKTLLANTDRRYVNRVFASTDAASWTELFSFRATTFAMSFEKVGDTFYFGMGTKDRVCDECGTIYRVNPTAGPVMVNFPTLTQSVSEGAGQTTVTLQLSEAAAEDVTVPLTLGGTAISGVDYSSVPTTVVIPAGSTTATFDIALVDDALFEVAETLILTMGAPTHAIAGSASKLTITIADNDGANKPAVRFTSESQSVAAGSTATLGVSLTKVSGAATTIGLSFEGTATNKLDYTVDKTSVTIPAGETEATVSFTLLERAAGKTVIASINYWPSNADMGAPRIHTMTVAASEAPPPALPTAAFASAAQTVQENAGTVSISVVLSQASSSAVSIPFTLDGTALAGADYQIPDSPLTIPAGQTSGTIDIVLAADGLAEPAETIIVELGTPTGATLGATTTHTLTIAASEAAAQADYAAIYVSGVGSDTNDGKTVGAPFRTLTKALSVAEDGAVIHVAPGWYHPADGLMVTNGVTIVADAGPEQTFLFASMTNNQAMVTVAHTNAVLSGLTVTGKDEDGNQPEQWGGLRVTAGVVTNCVISHHKTKGNTVNGAGCRLEGGTVVDCTFTNNFCWYSGNSSRGGAVTLEKGDALLDRCTVISNRIWQSSANANSPGKGDTSNAYGGGVYLKVGTVRNSLVVGNMSLSYGGGIAVEGTGRVLNCTVVGNKARLASGGIWQGGGTVTNCLCLGNVAHGVVDSADDPGFVDAANGDYRLNPASAAVDAADGADLGDLDLAGRPRVSGAQADKGCYEREASQTDFGISFRKLTPFAPGAVEFSAKAANGTLSDCLWTFDGSEQKTGATVTRVCEPGSVSVSFRANLNGQQVAVDRPNWFVAYGETVHVVVSNENPVFPYATWETAATNLNDAFVAVQRNGTILMGAGDYRLKDERTIDFPMTLRGDKGPEQTVLDAHAVSGSGDYLRPFQLRHPSAVLDGLTLRNGRGAQNSLAGGVAIRDGGQVTNCVFDACCGDIYSVAGVYVKGLGARILDCRFEGCWVDDDKTSLRDGVAIKTSADRDGEKDLLIDRCLVRGSHEGCTRSGNKVVGGNGAIWLKSGTVRNTIVTGSVLRGCGGIIATGSAKVENCTIVGNLCTNENETVAGLCVKPHGWDPLTAQVYNTIAWDNRWKDADTGEDAVKDVGGADDYASRLTSCWTAGDPKLRGSGKFAFRPTSGSPCIDAGSPLSWMDETAVDVYGRPRKQGKGPDIGAAEAFPAGFKILVR